MSLEEWQNKFSERVRYRMFMLGINNSDLARKIGVERHTIDRYLKGTRYPSVIVINNMAKVFGCDIGYLIDFGEMIENTK